MSRLRLLLPAVAPVVAPVLALVLAGCGASEQPEEDAAPSTSVSSERLGPLAERCRSLLPRGVAADPIALGGGVGAQMPGVEWGVDGGSSQTVLVLLHQTGPTGFCGWGPFAAQAAEQGLASVAFDLCGWAQARCPTALTADDPAQVELALAHARDELGASRVVLVGASMGGSTAVIAAAAGADVDAWVDVSGPASWEGVDLQSQARDLAERDTPGLVVYATSDGEEEYAAAQRLARRAGAGFLDGGSGHGYELLTDLDGSLLPAGQAVLDFALARDR